MTKKVGLLVLTILATCLLAACGPRLQSSDVSKFADEPAEQMLLAFNDQNYDKYIENTDAQFQAAVNEQQMKDAHKMISGKIGTYVPGSKKFKDAVKTSENNKKYIAVRYNAKFTKETADVVVTMVFNDDKSHKIGGIFFNSPKLRKK